MYSGIPVRLAARGTRHERHRQASPPHAGSLPDGWRPATLSECSPTDRSFGDLGDVHRGDRCPLAPLILDHHEALLVMEGLCVASAGPPLVWEVTHLTV